MTAEAAGKAREFGYSEVRAHGHPAAERHRRTYSAEGHGMLKVWMSHGDKVPELPLASSRSPDRSRARSPPHGRRSR